MTRPAPGVMLLETVTGAALALALLAACSPADSSAPATSAASTPTTSSPVPSPSSSPSLDTDLVLAPDGMADLRMGQAPGGRYASFDSEYCRTEYPDLEWSDSASGGWRVVLPDDLGAPDPGEGESDRDPVEIYTDEAGRLAVLLVNSPDLRTEAGLGLDSSVEEILAGYTDAVRDDSGGVSDLYIVEGGAGKLVFEVPVDRELADYWPDEDLGRASYVRLLSFDVEVRPIAASGGYSRCQL